MMCSNPIANSSIRNMNYTYITAGGDLFSDDMLFGWDGTRNAMEQEVGTYIWVITHQRFNDQGRSIP